MRSVRSAHAFLALAGASLVVVAAARADERDGRGERGGRAWSVEADVAPSCTRRFADELLAKTRDVRVVTDASAGRVRVTVVPAGTGFRGSLRIERPGAEAVTRELDGPACDAVMVGLALVAALDIDPPAFPPAAGVIDGGEGAREAGLPAPLAEVPGGRAEAGAPPPSFPAATLGVFAELESTSLAGPIDLGGGLGVDLSLRSGPLLRLRASISLDAEESSRSGSVLLNRWTVTPEICLFRFGLAGKGNDGLSFHLPCAGVDLGLLRADGRGPAIAGSSRERPWVAGRAAGRLELRLAPVTLSLSLGAIVPFLREELVFPAPVEAVYRAPAVAGAASLAAGVRFQ